MFEYLKKAYHWLRKASLYRCKIMLFSALISGVMLDMFIQVDLKNLTIQFGNNYTTSVIVLIGLILTCLIFGGFDFWLEKIKSKERTNKNIMEILKDPEVPKSIKIKLMNVLKSQK